MKIFFTLLSITFCINVWAYETVDMVMRMNKSANYYSISLSTMARIYKAPVSDINLVLCLQKSATDKKKVTLKVDMEKGLITNCKPQQ